MEQIKNYNIIPTYSSSMKKRILELLTTHGTLVSPEVVEYISTKPDPEKYIKSALKHLSEAPLFLTIEDLRSTEQIEQIEQIEKKEYKESNEYDGQNEQNEQNENEDKIKIEPSISEIMSTNTFDTNPVPNLPSINLGQEITSDIESGKFSGTTLISPENNLENLQNPTQQLLKSTPEIEITTRIQSLGMIKKPTASEYPSEINILKDVTGQSTSEGTLGDFTKYFRERFHRLRKLLQIQRREVMGTIDIARARTRQGPLKVFGLITKVRTTKQGHKILEIEDDTDTISVLVNNSSPIINMSLINDEVICVVGKLGKTDLIYAEDIIRPDVPITRNQARAEIPIAGLFISDIHIGSTTFLHKSWDRFVRWLNGKYSLNGQDTLRDNIKYIVIAGDIVDGIGIYPDQESELEISDIYAQYEALSTRFQDIPDYIQLIVQPGNHDAVRPAEPQPTFPDEITSLFNNNIKFVGNPCSFKMHNVDVLSYHGRSMDDYVLQIPEVSYSKPITIMKEMLARRHLAPVYGEKTPIAPEHMDYLVIDHIPDIFVTGHIHKTAVENYRDILLINASAWQSQTSYQKMMNFNPDPGKAIYTDLQTGSVQILSF